MTSASANQHPASYVQQLILQQRFETTNLTLTIAKGSIALIAQCSVLSEWPMLQLAANTARNVPR